MILDKGGSVINIIYSCDKNYLRHAAASITSLLENNSKEQIKIYLISNKLDKNSKKRITNLVEKYNQQINILDIDRICSKLNKSDDFPISGYARLFLQSFIEADKALYLDCDTIVLDSISELYNTNIENYYVAGVQDNPAKYMVEIIGMDSNDRYINSGVLLLNLKAWRRDNLEQQFIEFIKKYHGKVPHHDQGIINGVCRGKILILSPKYNLMSQFYLHTEKQIKKLFNIKIYYTQSEINTSKENPVIIHYIAKFFGRPWETDCTHPYSQKYNYYLKKSGFYQETVTPKKDTGLMIRKAVYNNFPFSVYFMFEKILDIKRKHKIKNNIDL